MAKKMAKLNNHLPLRPMHQAIVTKFIGPSNTKGARIQAKAEAGTKYYDWDHSLGVDANHRLAAYEFALALGWSGMWSGGWLPNAGCAWVNTFDAYNHVGLNNGVADFVIEKVEQ